MDRYKFYLTVLVFFSFFSCIPTKDLIYLQKNENQESENSLTIKKEPELYVLQPNDMITVKITASDPKLVSIFSTSTTEAGVNSEMEFYYNGYSVDYHGNIRIPILGEINVLGYTLDEVRKKIEKKLLSEYFTEDSNLFVSVKLSGFRYTINGEVSAPGTKTIYQNQLSILDAVANAGDITMTGNRKEVVVMRKTPTGIQRHILDLTDESLLNSPYFYLQPNDYIYVKPLKQKSWGTGKTGIESLSTIVTLLSLITTTYLLFSRI